MSAVSTIGILGGMGPEATNHLAALITMLTEAQNDQEHVPVITFNNPAIPSRVDAILNGAKSPLPELIRTARVLEHAGANFIIMPCNTAHYYVDEIASAINVPILNMVSLTASAVFALGLTHVGLLATDATIETAIYHRRLQENGVRVLTPDAAQQRIVMASIFGAQGIKAGSKEPALTNLTNIAKTLCKNGAQTILAGCTEISVVFHGDDNDLTFELMDPMIVAAQTAIQLAIQGWGEPNNRNRTKKPQTQIFHPRADRLHLLPHYQ